MTNPVQIFSRIPLPYKYVNIPTPNEPRNQALHSYYVNRVITNLTRDTFKHSGFNFTQDDRKWNTSWGRQYSKEEYRRCQSWQKINHFAGAYEMGRKDNLHKRMMELKSRVGDFCSFYPESYLLPKDQAQLNARWTQHKYWIVKPSASSRGRGIYMVSSEESEPVTDDGIVQFYIPNPLLVTKRKFDIRVYVLVTRIEPLRIYIHQAGLARFCTHEYDKDGNIDDRQMHLTNFSLNKEDPQFVRNDDKENINNSKWSLKFFLQYMNHIGYDPNKLMKEIERISIATIIAGMCEIKKTHSQLIPHRHTSYEMYGLDIMLDENMAAHLIEVNISPSLSGMDSKLDKDLKYPLNLDLLRMAQIIDCNCKLEHPCPAIDQIDDLYYKSMTPERVQQVTTGQVHPWDNPTFADYVIIRDFVEETTIQSGFRLIYPLPENMDLYFPCFDKLSYQDIVFTKWLKLGKNEKLAALQKNLKKYEDAIKAITNSLNAPQES